MKQAGILAYVVVTAWLTHPSRTLRKEDIPVSFVGDMTKPGRREFIQHLEENGIAVADYGFGSRNGSLSHEDIADVFLRSKINLNFTSTNPPAWVLRHDPMRAHKRQVKGRPFELAALGRFCLSEWAPCVDYWFTPGVDIGVFRDMDDLVQKTRRYLKENEQRHDMATAAQKKFLKELAPEIQFSRVFSEILTTCRDKDPHLTELPNNTPIFYESMGRSRGISFLYALHRGAPLRAIQEIFMKWSWHITYWRGFIGIGLEIVMRKFGRT